jgi:hypothetical protein
MGGWEPGEPVRATIDGREVEIRELYPGIFNAFDARTRTRPGLIP